MLPAPLLRTCLLTLSALLFLPLVTLAQFTGVTLPPAYRGTIPEFATTLGDALEITFANTAGFDGSFGMLDRGFGTYVAPRAIPASEQNRIYFSSEPVDKAPQRPAGRREKSSLSKGSLLLAQSSGDAWRDGRVSLSVFDSTSVDSPVRLRLP